jgi:hypothetical protein
LRSNNVLNISSNENLSINQFLDKEATLNKDFSISLIQSDFPPLNESNLRENLGKKLEKGTLYSSNEGNIFTFRLGFTKDDVEIDSSCYFFHHRQNFEPFNEYLLCFLVNDSQFNLDLYPFFERKHFYFVFFEFYKLELFLNSSDSKKKTFRKELDFYFEKNLKSYLNSNVESEEFLSLLRNWYANSIEYLKRTLELLSQKAAILFEEVAFNKINNSDSSN